CLRRKRIPELPLTVKRRFSSSLSRDRDGARKSRSPGSLAPTSGLWAAESRLARVGPTAPTRATRTVDASVDPTDGRNAWVPTQAPRRDLRAGAAMYSPVAWLSPARRPPSECRRRAGSRVAYGAANPRPGGQAPVLQDDENAASGRH